MLAKVYTGSLYGLHSDLITVETDLSIGLPALNLVGLADLTVRESKERIRSAILNSGYPFPTKRITVNLAPAATRKEGAHFDLPIAIGILAASGFCKQKLLQKYAFLGELSLDGRINAVIGALPLVIGLRRKGIEKIFLPEKNVEEAQMVKGVTLYPCHLLKDIVEHINGKTYIKNVTSSIIGHVGEKEEEGLDFSDIVGQEEVKRVAQIAAAAAHNLLMIGSPGSGKTLIAKRMPTILPSLNHEECLETTKLYSIAGELSDVAPIVTKRPFRAPHHSISKAAFVGGGAKPKPGEISLAHEGVLFLDELPEFKRSILELLRQPMEEGKVVINRLSGNITFPSRMMVIAAMNPCPCGYLGDPVHECTCKPAQIEAYRAKLSGPLLDRIDLQVEVKPVSYNALLGEEKCSKKKQVSSIEMKKLVKRAREQQEERYRHETIQNNSQLTPAMLQKYCKLERYSNEILKEAALKFGFSARACHKTIKVARTIADLEDSEQICCNHLAEALHYRLEKLNDRI